MMNSLMRSILRWTNLLLAATFLLGVVAGIFAQPAYRLALSALYRERYGSLVFKCDQAMREHFIAKARLEEAPADAERAALALQSEVALLDCNDYDILRKRLFQLGLTEVDLAAMELAAIEARGSDIRETVRIHEIRY
jgi:hypothetical protein